MFFISKKWFISSKALWWLDILLFDLMWNLRHSFLWSHYYSSLSQIPHYVFAWFALCYTTVSSTPECTHKLSPLLAHLLPEHSYTEFLCSLPSFSTVLNIEKPGLHLRIQMHPDSTEGLDGTKYEVVISQILWFSQLRLIWWTQKQYRIYVSICK